MSRFIEGITTEETACHPLCILASNSLTHSMYDPVSTSDSTHVKVPPTELVLAVSSLGRSVTSGSRVPGNKNNALRWLASLLYLSVAHVETRIITVVWVQCMFRGRAVRVAGTTPLFDLVSFTSFEDEFNFSTVCPIHVFDAACRPVCSPAMVAPPGGRRRRRRS